MIILRKPSLGIEDTLSASTPSDGEYKWFVPTNSVPATNYNIYIRSVTNASIYDLSDPFRITNAAGSFITVTSPTADSVWKMGTQRTITWDDNIAENVSIHLYKGGVDQLVLSASKPGSSHTFTVPTSLTAASDYQIRITSTVSGSIYDFSPNFQIIPADYIDFSGPAVFRMNDSVPITWNDNISEHVKIELLLADTLFRVISASTESDGSYLWGVPGNLPVEQWYKIRITSLANPSVADVSNASHIYFPFYIDIFNPEAGFVMLKNSSYPIQWNHNFHNGEHYNIDLYKGGDSLRRIRSYNAPAYYLWPITALYEDLPTGTDYSLRVSCYERPGVFDFSETFSILDCDSVLFSAGNDTVLYRNRTIDLIATDGFDNYFWTPMQAMTRVNHCTGSAYSTPGTMEVFCTASFSGGCVKQDSLILTIADPPCLAHAEFTTISYQDEPLCNTYTFCNLSDSTLGYRIQYDFGDVTMIDTTSVVVTHSFPGPGTYYVTCTVYDPDYPDCQDVFTDTITVEPAPSISFGYSVSVDTGLFVPVISGPGIYRVLWTVDGASAENLLAGNSDTDSLQVVFPANGTYMICAEVYDTLHSQCHYFHCEEVAITTIPLCHNTTGYFAVSPYDGYGSGNRNRFRFDAGVNEYLTCHQVTWDLGDGTPVFSDSLHFSHIYNPGTYIITMTVTNCWTCSFTRTDTVTAYPPLQTGLPVSATGCDSLTLNANPDYFYYVWQDSTESRTLPVYTSGSYWILVSDGNGYYHIDTTAASVYPTIQAGLDPIPVLCSNGSAYVLTEGTPSGGTYSGDHINGNSFNISGSGPGFHLVQYYFQNTQGCSDTAYGVIEVEPMYEGSRIIQNKTVTGEHYFTGDTIFTGGTVTDTLAQGPCIFLAGSETTLKAQAAIRFLPGTRVMPAGHLKAYIGPLSCLGDNSGRKLQEGAAARSSSGSPDLLIAPNPAADRAVLFSRTGTLDGYRMNLYNATGSPVEHDQVLGGKQVKLDLQRLQPGIYFVRIWNETESWLLKMIRE
ncbi:MAG TPA: Ser-Thr-rich GPI-anchored membrane family protein, partial [Bacteroidales bacterium]|nr:Ser-Thr-rich GPI-anchored membrane family protein [Bacteroidales bacterium]